MTDNHPMLSKFGDCHLCSPYDAAGELLTTTETAISYSGGTTSTAVASYTFTYNSLGEAVSVDNNGSGTSGTTGTPGVPDVRLSSTYDAAGNRTQLSAAIGASHTADFLNSYSYDSLNRPTQVKQSSQSGGDAVDSKLVNFSYNAAGQFKSIDRFNDLTGTPANRISTSSYGYDGLGRLTTLAHSNAKGSGNYAAYTWSYDAGNEATTFTNANYVNEGVSYGYDPTGQLVAASANGGSANASDSLTNTYDATGNATQTTVVGTTANKTVGGATRCFPTGRTATPTTRTATSSSTTVPRTISPTLTTTATG